MLRELSLMLENEKKKDFGAGRHIRSESKSLSDFNTDGEMPIVLNPTESL